MGPLVRAGITGALLAGASLVGCDVNEKVAAAVIVGGFLIDGDKTLEIIDNIKRTKLKIMPDITARHRILHSIFAWPFGLILSIAVSSWLPLIAVFLHALADSAIPGIVKNGKHYPSHSPLKWIAIPFWEKSWAIVTKGWPVTYPPEFNFIYTKLAPIMGGILFFISVLYWINVKNIVVSFEF